MPDDVDLPLDRCDVLTAAHTHESRGYLQARLSALSKLLREEAPRDLTRVEVAAIIPGKAPAGCPQNRVRGRILRALNDAGFTVGGKRCT